MIKKVITHKIKNEEQTLPDVFDITIETLNIKLNNKSRFKAFIYKKTLYIGAVKIINEKNEDEDYAIAKKFAYDFFKIKGSINIQELYIDNGKK